MTTQESTSLPMRDLGLASHLLVASSRISQDRHNLDAVLAFSSCFGVWLLVVTSLLIALH